MIRTRGPVTMTGGGGVVVIGKAGVEVVSTDSEPIGGIVPVGLGTLLAVTGDAGNKGEAVGKVAGEDGKEVAVTGNIGTVDMIEGTVPTGSVAAGEAGFVAGVPDDTIVDCVVVVRNQKFERVNVSGVGRVNSSSNGGSVSTFTSVTSSPGVIG